MGVKGVAELFYSKRVENERGWTKETIRTEKLVVDANQFCHQVSGFKKSRNNYAGFSECVAKIIHKLRGWRVEPYFVYDGVDKEQKFRRSSDSKPLMPLVYTVLRHVLGEEKVDVCVGDGEGDETCVKVANSFNCPVLSQDSDYLFFDISGGYIDWKFCPIESLFDSDSKVFEIEVYRRKEFVQTHFSGVDDHLFMFPVIINKGIHPEAGKQFENEPYAGFVDDFIKQSHPSISSSFSKTFEKEFLKVKVYYNEPGQENPEEILAQKIPKCEKDLPVWLHNSYRRFEIPYVMLFDVLVNGKQHHSRSDLSKHIRQSWYAIIGVREVKEYTYDDDIITVPCGPRGPITLKNLDDKDSFVKKRVFYNALCCNEREAELSRLEGERLGERFVIATIIFWMKNSEPPIILCKALLACFVRLSNMHRERVVELCRSDGADRTLSNGKLHLERWQSVYKDASVLFLLLRYPLDSIPCPSRVFNERIILDLINDAAIDGFIRDGNVQEKYDILIEILGV